MPKFCFADGFDMSTDLSQLKRDTTILPLMVTIGCALVGLLANAAYTHWRQNKMSALLGKYHKELLLGVTVLNNRLDLARESKASD